MSKPFATLWTMFEVKHLKTTPYRSETNGQAEQLHCDIVTKMRRYVEENQRLGLVSTIANKHSPFQFWTSKASA